MLERLSAIVGILVASLAFSTPAAAEDCDRACLGDLVTQYVDAVLAHDPSSLPLAEGAEYTEGGRAVEFGKGAWESITGKGTFRHDYLDTRKQVAASHIHFLEGEIPVLVSVALHVEDGKIADIETIVARVTPDSPFQPAVLHEPVRGMDRPLAEGERMSREDMVAIALRYAEGLRIGNFEDVGVPFAPEVYRVENGVITAGQGCFGSVCGLYEQRIMVHPGLIPSVVAVDEENGTVVLWMNFGFTDSYGPGRALVTFEAFKIWGGSIHAINAFFDFLPIGRSRGWPSEDPVPRLY
ncbi:MAG TPA: hypothetical protein VLA37_00450 [Sphingomonadaceae bacterium]|nr:hypothetical protein [Sphingomonadaceae bacterium]